MTRPEETFTLRSDADDDGVETLDLWAWEFLVTANLMSDMPALETMKRMEIESAREAAERNGYELAGEPVATEEPLVWLPEMNDGRGGFMGLAVARSVGYDGEATAYLHHYRFPARRKQP